MLAVPQQVGEVGETMRVVFELKFAQISRSLELAAVIRNVNAAHGPNATGYRLGMQFQEISEQDALFVMGFVYEQLSVARGVTHPAATARSGCAISAGSSTPGRRALQSERQR